MSEKESFPITPSPKVNTLSNILVRNDADNAELMRLRTSAREEALASPRTTTSRDKAISDNKRDGDAERLRGYVECPTNTEEIEWFLQQITNRDAALREARAEIEQLQKIKAGYMEIIWGAAEANESLTNHNAAMAEVVQAARNLAAEAAFVARMLPNASDLTNKAKLTQEALARLDSAPADEGWRPIETAPKDTTQGDFLIANFNTRGDCCWIAVVRNPHNHHGMTIATHWAMMFYPAPPPAPREDEHE